MRPRRLKLGTHVDSGQMYHVYRNLAAAAYSSLYSFFFLSNFQTLRFFVTLFSGTEAWKVHSGQIYCVYRNQVAAAYSSLYFFLSNFQTLNFFVTLFMWTVGRCIMYTGIRLVLLICPCISSVFFLSNFQILKIFVTLFSRTVRPRRLTLDTHVDIGWMYRVYRNQAATSYLSFIS